MPHLSRFKLSKRAEEEIVKNLEIVLTKLSKEDDMKEFLLSLLTPTERVMLAKRLSMVVLIKEGVPESHIASTLHVTRETVSRMQLFLEARGKGYDSAFNKLKNDKLLKEFRTFLIDLVKYALSASGGKVKTKGLYKLFSNQ